MNVKVSDGELELMAEGLHPRDIVWLEERIEALESTLKALLASEADTYESVDERLWARARAVLSEGDASD